MDKNKQEQMRLENEKQEKTFADELHKRMEAIKARRKTIRSAVASKRVSIADSS